MFATPKHRAARFPDGELDRAAELGAVDDRSVRLWLRQQGTPTISATLEVAGRAPVTGQVALSPDTDWTGVLHLALPSAEPDTPFVCRVGDQVLRGRLAPTPGQPSRVVFGFGSCHLPFAVTPGGELVRRPAAAIYPVIRAELVRRQAQFLLLIGDQIYSDALAPLDVGRLLDAGPPPAATALAAYRRISRGFLGEAGMRRLRETFPT